MVKLFTVQAVNPRDLLSFRMAASCVQLPAVDFGYAVTAHSSQGKSVDSVIISADGMQKELFYVRHPAEEKAFRDYKLQGAVARIGFNLNGADVCFGIIAEIRPGLYQGCGAAGSCPENSEADDPTHSPADRYSRLWKEERHELRMEQNLDLGSER